MRLRAHACIATLLVGGCGTTTVTYVTPWLRETWHKEPSFDSGAPMHGSVERRHDGGWERLPHARNAVALEGGRAAMRTDAERVVIVTEAFAVEDVPSCASREAVLSPDARRIVCFERGLIPIGFIRDVLYLLGETEVTTSDRRCRLVEVDASGRTTTRESTVHYPPDSCWDTLAGPVLADQRYAKALPGP